MSPWILIIRPNSYHSDRRLNSSFQKFSCAIWILEPCRAGNSNCKRRWRRKQPSKLVMAKFLGMQFSCHLTTSHQKGSWEVALRVLLWKLSNIDKAPIDQRWVQTVDLQLVSHIIPPLLPFSESTTINSHFKMQAMGMKKLKGSLGLTQSTTIAVIHHPNVLGVPFLPQLQSKAKLTFLFSVISSIARWDNFKSVGSQEWNILYLQLGSSFSSFNHKEDLVLWVS